MKHKNIHTICTSQENKSSPCVEFSALLKLKKYKMAIVFMEFYYLYKVPHSIYIKIIVMTIHVGNFNLAKFHFDLLLHVSTPNFEA